jgi:cysteine synthase A
VAVIQPGVSVKRTQILKAYGVILLQFSDIPSLNELIAEKGMILASLYELIERYADAHGYYYLNQGLNREIP